MDSSSNEAANWYEEASSFLALHSIRGVGFKTLHRLADSGISFEKLLQTPPDVLRQFVPVKHFDDFRDNDVSWRHYTRSLKNLGEELLHQLQSIGVTLVFRWESRFPYQLRELDNAPQWLFVQGDIANISKPGIAIVGSRRATEDGLCLTQMVVAALVDTDLITISGLAEGIDQKAHRESLRFRIPTIAVLGTGIDQDFPQNSGALRNDILHEGGTVITEYLPGQSYSAENFVLRNRIQASLAAALVPVEWKIRSGTAHTVNFGKQYMKSIAMPYLPYPSLATPEVLSILDYTKGSTFAFPNESLAFREFALEAAEIFKHRTAHAHVRGFSEELQQRILPELDINTAYLDLHLPRTPY